MNATNHTEGLRLTLERGPYTVHLEYIPAHKEGDASFQMSARFDRGTTLGGVGVQEWEETGHAYLGSWPAVRHTVETLDCFHGESGAAPLKLFFALRKDLSALKARTQREEFYLLALADLVNANEENE